MHISLSSDYGALEQSLPGLIGCAEAATSETADEPAALQTHSDVYAVVGWTLIKADSPLGAWIATAGPYGLVARTCHAVRPTSEPTPLKRIVTMT